LKKAEQYARQHLEREVSEIRKSSRIEEHEKEVLFRPNRTFRILKVSEELSRTVITMEEV